MLRMRISTWAFLLAKMNLSPKKLPEATKLLDKFSYDPDNGLLTYRTNSGKMRAGSIAGYLSRSGYKKICHQGEHYFSHRLIWKMVYGVDPLGEIDHINRNRTDNRLSNLRDVLSSVNNANKEPPRGSDFVGVYFNKTRNKWQARVEMHLGYFDDPNSAKEKRDAMLLSLKKILCG